MISSSFWTDNPFAPTWRAAVHHLWSGTGPELCVKGCVDMGWNDGGGGQGTPLDFSIAPCTDADVDELAEFLQRWYQNTLRARCVVSATWIRQKLAPPREWNTCCLARAHGGQKRIVGCVVQWNAGWLRVSKKNFSNARAIDYLCVAGGWRKKGVARQLLFAIHTAAAAEARAIGANQFPPHFFCLEQPQLRIPPFSWTPMVARSGAPAPTARAARAATWDSAVTAETVWRAAVASGRTCSLSSSLLDKWNTISSGPHSPPRDTLFYTNHHGLYFIRTDTQHITVPCGKRIYTLDTVPRAPTAEELEGFVDTVCAGTLVLCPAAWSRMNAGWEPDASVQWISYNLQTGPIPDSQPPLLLLSY